MSLAWGSYVPFVVCVFVTDACVPPLSLLLLLSWQVVQVSFTTMSRGMESDVLFYVCLCVTDVSSGSSAELFSASLCHLEHWCIVV